MIQRIPKKIIPYNCRILQRFQFI